MWGIEMAFDFSRTSISIGRPLSSYSKVIDLIGWAKRGKKAFLKQPADGVYIDIGCGPNMHPTFYGIDYSWRPGLDLCWDITKGLPIPSSVANGIFSEHCLEHISFAECIFVTKEFYRIMKPGAAVRIVVPDGELYARKYLGGEAMPYATAHQEYGFYTPFMSVNQIFYNHGHRYIYDFATMAKVLEHAGFRQIEKASYREGGDPRLLVDDESRAVESLYVTALK